MSKPQNIPDVVPLVGESVLSLSVAHAWLKTFPSALRKYGRLNPDRLHLAIDSREISHYGLLCAAYIGVAPLPCTYGRFITQAERVNKVEPHAHASSFRKNRVARENSAASEYEMSAQEFKRLLKRLDTFAEKFAGVPTYDAVFNCKSEILRDQSPLAPTGRETYAEGPLYLWDFAKAVNEHNLVDMSFDTFSGWVLFVHRGNGIVSGLAIHPQAHRFGNFSSNPLINTAGLCISGGRFPIIDTPREVLEALKAFADRRFRGHPFEFMPPPMTYMGEVYPSKRIRFDLYPSSAEG